MLAPPIGHDSVRNWLKQAIGGNRLGGAYLFIGPDGIGKAGVAAEFAAAMRCESPADGWACGKCGECSRVAKGLHPSVKSFAKPADKSAFPVELVRDIADEASLKRFEPGRRVFIVADADRFNESSANAFLKTLEEPPADLTFVLLAGNAAQVLPTILSRCQVVRFAPLAEAQVGEVVRGWEGLPVNPEARAMLIRAAQGSPGRLKRLIDGKVLDTARDFLKAVNGDPFQASELLAASLSGDDNEQKREQLRDVLALLTAALRDRMAGALGAMHIKPLTRVIGDEPRSADAIAAAVLHLDDLRERVDGNANLKLACDAIALSWPA
jgi:DNA polymerase-3 subunit delta'